MNNISMGHAFNVGFALGMFMTCNLVNMGLEKLINGEKMALI